MTFLRPTLAELQRLTDAELSARLGLGPLPPRSVLGVLAHVSAGLSHSAHGHLDHIADQIFPATATGTNLERHASLRGITRKAAAFASGSATFTGTSGSTVPLGARLARADGAIYETTEEATLSAGVGLAAIEAVLPGSDGNAVSGTLLTLQTPSVGVVPTVTASAIEGGTDQETDDELRARVLLSWRSRPMAGTSEDYVGWALEVPGITRAFVRPRTPTLGMVTVMVVADGNEPTIEPTAAQIEAVLTYLDTVRPVTARVVVEAPVLEALDLTIELSPPSATVRARVIANLEDAITREAVPGGTIRLSRLSSAISASPGEIYHRITSPSVDVVADANTLLVPGVVTWS
jgi:uncharacterized phage protein gp47/JayE